MPLGNSSLMQLTIIWREKLVEIKTHFLQESCGAGASCLFCIGYIRAPRGRSKNRPCNAVMALWIKSDGGGGHIGILGVSFYLFLPHSDVTEVSMT